jgi:DNA-binding NarL/FixJ family response regulator
MNLILAIADDRTREHVLDALDQIKGLKLFKVPADPIKVIRKVARHRSAMVLLDLPLASMEGLSLVRRLRREDANLPIAVLCTPEEINALPDLIRKGVRGFLLPATTPDEIRLSLSMLGGGGAVVFPVLAMRLLIEFATRAPAGRIMRGGVDSLTDEERETLHEIAGDSSPAQCIARMAAALTRSAPDQTRTGQPGPLLDAAQIVGERLRSVLDKMRTWNDSHGPDLLDDGVPRRPSPGGLWAAAEAVPDPDTDDHLGR